MENEELIRKQMEETRTSLTEKLETLEDQVVGTVKDTGSAVSGTAEAIKDTVSTVKDSVQDTVSTVKDTVEETVSAVKDTVQEGVETVKSWLDLKAHTEKRPWMVMGGSVVLGYFLEGMVGSGAESETVAAPDGHAPRREHHNGGMRHRRHEHAPAGGLTPELGKLKGLALGALLGTVRELVAGAAPDYLSEQLREIADDITRSLGGKPVPRPGEEKEAKSKQEERPEQKGKGTLMGIPKRG